VRNRWDSELAKHGSVTINIRPGDETFNKAMLELADAYAKDPRLNEFLPRVDELFRKFVNAGNSSVTSVSGTSR
jgi:hypothetical protein